MVDLWVATRLGARDLVGVASKSKARAIFEPPTFSFALQISAATINSHYEYSDLHFDVKSPELYTATWYREELGEISYSMPLKYNETPPIDSGKESQEADATAS